MLFRFRPRGPIEQTSVPGREAARWFRLWPWPAFVFLAVLVLTMPQEGVAQVNSNTSSVTMTATLAESLTVTALPSAVNFTLVSGGNATGSTAVAVTTAWVLGATRTSVDLYGSFASSTAALTDGAGDDIPSSAVLGQVATGLPTSFTAFTQTGPFGGSGASLELFSQTISSTNLSGTRSDNLNLEIDLSSLTTLPAGTYTGTLNIQAQAL